MINVMMVMYKMVMDVLHNVKYKMDLIAHDQVAEVFAKHKLIR
jgi:hypothetical protein